MASSVQFHSLLRDELIYEVIIRSETPASTVEGLRKQLRSLVGECRPDEILETELAPDSELKIISDKLNDLSSLVTKFVQSKDRYSGNRSKALGNHLYFRLLRVQVEEDPAKLALKVEFSSRLDALLAQLDSVGQTSSTSSEGVSVLAQSSQAVPTRELQVHCSGDKNVAKWGVKFNGSTDPRSFLERVEELKLAYGVSDVVLFNSAAQLFVDQGLLWYRGIKEQVSSWNDLKAILLDEFEPANFDFRLRCEILARTQGLDEPVHIYFAIMSCLFGRLKNPLPEEEKLQILMNNIRPSFSQQLALVNIASIAELKDCCRKLEQAAQRTQYFVEPGKAGSAQTLSSDFAYKGKAKQVNAVNVSNGKRSQAFVRSQSQAKSNAQQGNAVRNVQRSSTQSTHAQNAAAGPVCYKCGGTAHNFRKCNGKPSKGIYSCFSCGQAGHMSYG
ncbi:uncharacterized protein LOC125237321 [Leguminivora glycinivorella]|uniref:uncharacterized protein LOC125237321 n=1 Tax=Leguminivora glycinivorella TaxID=1035111 RepID=UPI00200DFCE1|nr:uncharacterized protein LOC125237321 [Leguminivora glycinivorella]